MSFATYRGWQYYSKPIPSIEVRSMNAKIYESLYVITQATEQITKHIERLRKEKLLTAHFAEVRILAAQQNRSEINVSVVHWLAHHEQRDAGHFEQKRLKREARLKES